MYIYVHVVAKLRILPDFMGYIGKLPAQTDKKENWLGWEPQSVEVGRCFQRNSLRLGELSNLEDFQQQLQQMAAETDFTTAGMRNAARKDDNDSVKAARRSVLECVQRGLMQEPLGRHAAHKLREAKRKRKKKKTNRGLLQLRRGASVKPPRNPLTLWVDGDQTSNRILWREFGQQFGQKQFDDATNCFEAQHERLQLLTSAQRSERLDGRLRQGIDCFDTFSARAEKKLSKASGADLIVSECFKWLPFTAVVWAWKLFDKYFGDPMAAAPASWDTVPHAGLAKRPGADRLDEHRWVSKLPTLFQWYCRTWKHRLRSKTAVAVSRQ